VADFGDLGPKKSQGNVTRSLLAIVAVLFTLASEAPFVAGSIVPTVRPKVSRQTSDTYVQFFGQRWHVVVDYNGTEAIFDYNPEWKVEVILERAIHTFRIVQGQPPFSLFNLAGLELPGTASAEDAGIQPGDHLLLRPSKVKAGDESVPILGQRSCGSLPLPCVE
jgi:hypothetical protein